MADNITRSLRIDPQFYRELKAYASATNQPISEAIVFGLKTFYYSLAKGDPIARKVIGKFFNVMEDFSFQKSTRIVIKSVDDGAFKIKLNEVNDINELEDLETSFLAFIDRIRERKKELMEEDHT